MSTITLTIDQSAIEEALLDYVEKMGMSITNCDTSLDMTAGRGANGFSASITLTKRKEPSQVKTACTSENPVAEVQKQVEEPPKQKESKPVSRPPVGLFKSVKNQDEETPSTS